MASLPSAPWTFSSDGIWATSIWNARVLLASIVRHSTMNGIDALAVGRLMAAAPVMKAALEAVQAVRPVNWEDDEDPEQREAWAAVDSVLAALQ